MNRKKIIIFTTGRADFYLLSLIIEKLKKNKKFQIRLVATGNHFDKKKGSTYKDIIKKNLSIDYKVPFRDKKGSKIQIINQISNAFKLNSKILNKLKPDIILVLGDRFELIPIVYSALILGIPIAHIQGGEVTEGAFDDSIRHSITKLSNLHFVCNSVYKKRIINMGEDPRFVFDVGGIGAELVSNQTYLSKKKLEGILKINLNKKIILVCVHPETKSPSISYKTLFNAINKIKENFLIIFTSPNSDPGHDQILKEINKIKKNENCFYFTNLGSKIYHSLLNLSSLLIGNSSSGILEAPILKVPTVNIGSRQKGRLLEQSVYNTNFNEKEILKTIKRALKRTNIKKKIKYHKNKKASEQVIKILSKINLKKINNKKFYDIK